MMCRWINPLQHRCRYLCRVSDITQREMPLLTLLQKASTGFSQCSMTSIKELI
ncbi:hypothetical protein HCH_04200 [Hahella chejuensis KCTC 2396]|uniref:Uncharacterized protein n=1 Tax=Hahella chejuensis (strain KCTC 2396) TaxID=349521 RepID=Q2SEL6_HAHCH|nr:hypothetical protein HCH_04200 [Hahella chejuensis KCTC 2396]